MSARRYRAIPEEGAPVDDPSDDRLYLLFTTMEGGGGTFLILERVADASGQTYAQAARFDDGTYILEHRAGGPKAHFATNVPDFRGALALMTGWATERAGWDDGHEWRRVTT